MGKIEEGSKVCAELQYRATHSDICPQGHVMDGVTDDHREMLHRCLDEWLDRSEGEGWFWVGDPTHRPGDLPAHARESKETILARQGQG